MYCINVTGTYYVTVYVEVLGEFKIHLILAFCMCIIRIHLIGDFTSLKCIFVPIFSYCLTDIIYVLSTLFEKKC
jgi:hypothetical protein